MLTFALIIALTACLVFNVAVVRLHHQLQDAQKRLAAAEETIRQSQEATLHQRQKLRELIVMLRGARHDALLYDSKDEVRMAEWTIKRLEKLT